MDVDEPSIDGFCQVPCITSIEEVYSDPDLIHTMFITWSVLNWVSFVFVIVTLGVFIVVPALREWPHRITIFIGISLFWVHLAGIGASFFSLEGLECASNWEYNYAGWCKFQAWALQFGSLATACWWFVQGLVIFWSLTLLRPIDDNLHRFEPLFHIFSWCYPLTVAFILGWVPDYRSTGGSPNGVPQCVGTNFLPTGLFWGLYAGFFIFLILVNIIFISSAFVRLFCMHSQTGNFTRSFRVRLPAQGLIGSFVMCYMVVLSSSIAFIAWATQYQSELTDSFTDYYACILTTSNTLDSCTKSLTFNSSIAWFLTITVGLIGTWYGIIFLVFRLQTREQLSQWIKDTKIAISGSSPNNLLSQQIKSGTRDQSSYIDSTRDEIGVGY